MRKKKFNCSVPNCCFEGLPGRSFHEFPSNEDLRRKWLQTIQYYTGVLLNPLGKKMMYVCGNHFEEDCFTTRKNNKMYLKQDSYPSIFMNCAPVPTPLPLINEPVSVLPQNFNFNPEKEVTQSSFSYVQAPECLPESRSCQNFLLEPSVASKDPYPYTQAPHPEMPVSAVKQSKEAAEELTVNSEQILQADFHDSPESDNTLIAYIIKLENELKNHKRKFNRLNKSYEEKNEQLKNMQEELDKNREMLVHVNKIKDDCENNEPNAVFLMDQIKNYKVKKPKWSEITIKYCAIWRYASPKGYEYPRSKLLKLPSRTTLDKYVGINDDQTLGDTIKMRLKTEAESLSPIERICSLVIDDMAIKEKLEYVRTEDRMYGLETNIKEKRIGERPTLANKMLCYVIEGLSTQFTIPAAYFFHRALPKENFFELTMNVLKTLYECGFTVLRMVTDNHKSNVYLFKMFGNGELLIQIQHPVVPSLPLFLSFDYVHGIKNGRNLFLERDMASETGIITSNFLKKLHDIQKNFIVKPVRFLTKKHIYPSNLEKMNVARAVQIFSPPVTAALKYLNTYSSREAANFSGAEATIEYMETMYQFFKIHNAGKISKQDPLCAPFFNVHDERLQWLDEVFPAYIRSIQIHSKKENLPGLSKETAEALIFTARSTCACIRYLLNDVGFGYILTKKFSSDSIEAMFSHVRARGGFNDMTDAKSAQHALRQILRCGIVQGAKDANLSSKFFFQSSNVITTSRESDVDSELEINLPDDILEEISNLHQIPEKCGYGIASASVSFLSGYLVRVIEERVQCDDCLMPLISPKLSSPLLGLIYLQDRGSHKYPSRQFTCLINKILQLITQIIPHLKCVNTHFRSVLTSVFLEPLKCSNFFWCNIHKQTVIELILEKLIKPALSNYCLSQNDKVMRISLNTKPTSRKVLKL